MIANIVTGGDMAGLMRYLFGPGRANEHTEQHLVAGDPLIMMKWGDWSELSMSQATEMGHTLDSNMTSRGMDVTGPIRNYNAETGETEVVGQGHNHVWHCSLSLSPEEGPLSEEKWAGIAQDFMDAMGFTEASGKAPCQWVAVHHGVARNGGDHIHIAANVVREDGTKWSPWRDQVIASKAVNGIEHKYGLEVIEAREHGRSARADSADALNAAKKAGRANTDRQMLETRIRAAATAADSEVDFIRRARELGVRARPRFAKGHTDIVLGYSVALHTKPGERTQWYGGGSLARDLALARLRDRWPDTPTGAADAVEAWRDAWKGLPPRHGATLYSQAEWDARRQALDTMLTRMREVDPTDPVALADATQDVAGLLAAAAHREGITQREQQVFERASRQVGHHAQLKRRPAIPRPTDSTVALVAGLMSTALTPAGSSMSEIMTLMATMRLVDALADLYRQARQTNTARAIERDTAQAWALVHNDRHTAAQAQQRFERLAAQPAPLQQATLPAPQAYQPPDSQSSVAAAAEHILEADQDKAQPAAAAAQTDTSALNRRRLWLTTPSLTPKGKKTPTPPAPRKPNTDADRHAEGRRL
jgi:hypothetical protein